PCAADPQKQIWYCELAKCSAILTGRSTPPRNSKSTSNLPCNINALSRTWNSREKAKKNLTKRRTANGHEGSRKRRDRRTANGHEWTRIEFHAKPRPRGALPRLRGRQGAP